MIVMSQEAYVRFGPELKDGGTLIVEQDLVRVSDLDKKKEIKIYSIPATRIAEELGKKMVQNSVMVGFFTAITHLLDARCGAQGRGRFRPAEFPRVEPESIRRGFEYGNTALAATPPRQELQGWHIRASRETDHRAS